jgi:hypothetical protein
MHDAAAPESARRDGSGFRRAPDEPIINAPMLTPRTRPRATLSLPRAAALGLAVGLALAPAKVRAAPPSVEEPSTKVAFAGANRDTLAFDFPA